MNDMQKKFFKHIADIQETCVEVCLIKHKNMMITKPERCCMI